MSLSPTPRDELLLKLIMPGACTFSHLWDESGAFFSSSDALRQRISQLAQNEFIISQIYYPKENEKFALYALGPAGVNFLSRERHYQPEQLRTLLPSAHTVSHELVVTDAVRRLLRESLQIPYYLRYYDDPICRKHKKLLGLRGPLPDLLVDIKYRWVGSPYRLLFEVHMGTVPLLDVVDKATKQLEWQIIYLCTNYEDIRDLRTAMQEHREKLKAIVYFTTIYEFCTGLGGIFGSNFITLEERRVSLYP